MRFLLHKYYQLVFRFVIPKSIGEIYLEQRNIPWFTTKVFPFSLLCYAFASFVGAGVAYEKVVSFGTYEYGNIPLLILAFVFCQVLSYGLEFSFTPFYLYRFLVFSPLEYSKRCFSGMVLSVFGMRFFLLLCFMGASIIDHYVYLPHTDMSSLIKTEVLLVLCHFVFSLLVTVLAFRNINKQGSIIGSKYSVKFLVSVSLGILLLAVFKLKWKPENFFEYATASLLAALVLSIIILVITVRKA